MQGQDQSHPGDGGPGRGRLPRVLTPLVGRAAQVEEIGSRLARRQLVTLTGMGGVGKSRLALGVARAAESAGRRTIWVDLAGIPAAAGPGVHLVGESRLRGEVAAAVAAVACGDADPHRSTPDRLIRALADADLLLVLDGCDRVLGGCRELVTMLLDSCPDVSIVATTRELLGVPGELTWPVAALPVTDGEDDAVRLFLDRAVEARPELAIDPGTVEVVQGICRRLDGLPLAIELAAARLRVLSVQQIAAGLDDCLRMVAAPGAHLVERHRTLQATIDFSHERLPAAEAALFRRLAVFPVGATLEAVQAVADGGDVLDPLTRLVERSLVQVQPDGVAVRYRLPEAARQYAAVRLDEAAETVLVRERQLTWALGILERDVGAAGWLDGVESELGNLRQAMVWAGEQSPAVALRLAGRLWRFCWLRGRYSEGRAWIADALRAAEQRLGEPADRTDLARVLHGAGVLAYLQCDYDEAIDRLHRALTAYPETAYSEAVSPKTGDAVSEVLRSLAGIARERGEYDEAVKILGQARRRAQAQGDVRAAARSDLALGLTAWLRADWPAVRAAASPALTAYRRLGDPVGIAEAELLFGLVELSDGNRENAVALLRAVLAQGQRQGAREIVAYALHGLGVAARLDADPVTAQALLRECLAVHHDLGDRWRSASVLDDLAHCALSTGDPVEAARLLGAADAARDAIGVPVPRAERPAREALVRSVENAAGGQALVTGLASGGLQGMDRVVEHCLTPPLLSVRALGGSQIRLGDQTIEASAWGYAKPRELLHFLLSGQPSGKAEIGLALWPEADPGALRGAFHTTLNRLRRVIGADRVVYAGGRYSIDRSIALDYDVEAFRTALREAAATEDPESREHHLRTAARAYRGEYLSGETVGEWADGLRAQLQRSAERTLLELGRLLLQRGEPGAAVSVFRRALELDPLLEAAHRGLMHCQVGLGEPARALRQFELLQTALREQVDAVPAPGTAALADRIRVAATR